MTPYLPQLADLAALGVTWLLAVVLLLAGAAATGRRVAPEFQLLAGWGLFCLALTGWGVLLPWSLRLPAFGFVILALAAALLLPERRPARGAWQALGRMLAVSLPLWLVMAPIRPAEPDTWLNLLPNTVYLVDYGLLPTAARPPSFSFLPAAPYNTQLLAFLGALVDPAYPAPGLSLINLLLLLACGLLVARVAAPAGATAADGTGWAATPPGWVATGFGLLAVTLLNPGFVPRIHLAPYGETGLAATALTAAWLLVQAQGAHVEGRRSPGLLLPLALVLAAMVNIKQSGPGLVAAVALAGLGVAWWEGAGVRAKSLAFILKAVLPAVALWLAWRWFVAHAAVAELEPLPLAQWQWGKLPATLGSIAGIVAGKGVYFGCVALAVAALPVLRRRLGWTATTRLLALHALLLPFYTGFLLLTYVGHFPGTEAHSFFRYETHLSLVLVLALALALRDLGAARLAIGWLRDLPSLTLGLALAAPVAAISLLRFDLVMPQPLVWGFAKGVAPYVKDGGRLALLLPGDNGSVAIMLEGVLADTPPRRRGLDILRLDRADAAAFARAAAGGYDLAFVSCTPERVGDVPAHDAVLFKLAEGKWRPLAVWAYPGVGAHRRWQHVLAWPPLCRGA